MKIESFYQHWLCHRDLRLLREAYDRNARMDDFNNPDTTVWRTVMQHHKTWVERFTVIVNVILNSTILVKSGKVPREDVAAAHQIWANAKASELISENGTHVVLDPKRAPEACRAVFATRSNLPKTARQFNKDLDVRVVNASQIFTYVYYDDPPSNRRMLPAARAELIMPLVMAGS